MLLSSLRPLLDSQQPDATTDVSSSRSSPYIRALVLCCVCRHTPAIFYSSSCGQAQERTFPRPIGW